MTGLPLTTVLLDNGTGTFPYDVSAYCRLSAGVSLSRGWSDENEQDGITPGQVTLRLDNLDGRFTLGSTTYPGSSGALQRDQRLRIVETVGGTAYTRFTGYVTDWPTEWESALANLAYASITVVDRMARLNRRTLQPVIDQEMLQDAPVALYSLGEAAGALKAGDTSGNLALALALAGDASVGALTFGATAGDIIGSAASFPVQSFAAGAPRVQALQTNGAPTPVGTGVTWEMLFSTTATQSGSLFISYETGAPIVSWDIVAGGRLQATLLTTVLTTPAAVNDGAWHHVAHTWDGTTVRLYVDGVQVASTARAGTPVLASTLSFSRTNAVTLVAHVGIYASAVAAARIQAHSDAGLNGLVSDRSDQRLARLANYAKVPAAEQSLEVGSTYMAPSLTDGKSALEAMREVAAAEGGALFVNPAGQLVLQNKMHRPLAAAGTPKLTLTADQIAPDARWSTDDYLYNTAKGTRRNGAEQRAVNAASVAKYEEWPADRSAALLLTDQAVLDQLTWLVRAYGEPLPRLASVTLDLLTLPVATVQAALALEIGDLIRVTGWPSQSPAAAVNVIVEGIKEAKSVGSGQATWTLTLNTAPAALFKAWVLGSATLGVLESTTVPYF